MLISDLRYFVSIELLWSPVLVFLSRIRDRLSVEHQTSFRFSIRGPCSSTLTVITNLTCSV